MRTLRTLLNDSLATRTVMFLALMVVEIRVAGIDLTARFTGHHSVRAMHSICMYIHRAFLDEDIVTVLTSKSVHHYLAD